MLDSLLDHLARSRGIGDAYYDYRGELKQVSPATKKAILAVMGCQVDDAEAIAHEIAELDAARWRTLLPCVAVIRPGHTGVIVALPGDCSTGRSTGVSNLRTARAAPAACARATSPKESGANSRAAG